MIPKKRNEKMVFETVKIDEWITGTIDKIERDEAHKTIWEGKERTSDCIRFVFSLDGYQYPHKSRWMSFTYYEKGNLYQKFLKHLIPGFDTESEFDIESLVKLKIKTMWSENTGKDGNVYQNIEMVRPIDTIKQEKPKTAQEDVGMDSGEEELPF